MIRRSLVAAIAVLVPGIASAGVGVSYSPAITSVQVLTDFEDPFGIGSLGLIGGDETFLPTIDVRTEAFDLQFHALDFLKTLAGDGDILLGANGYYHLVRNPAGSANVVFDPGAQLDLGYISEEVLLQLLVAGRAGIEVGEPGGPGAGFYAIPDLGVYTYAGTSAGVFGASVGFSVWY